MVETCSRKLEIMITDVLVKLGCPANLKGYYYLREAIQYVVIDIRLIDNITKKLYVQVADRFSTTGDNVGRSIQNAIEVIWKRKNNSVMEKYFYYCVNIKKHRPTNGEFIATIADNIRLSMSMEEF